MSLSKFDYDMWRGVNITMPGGTHNNIYFEYSKENTTSGRVALDSVSLIPGTCLHKSKTVQIFIFIHICILENKQNL